MMLWPTHLEVLLRPGEIRVAQRRALLPDRGARVEVYPVGTQPDVEPWRASVDALDTVLLEAASSASVHLIVSDHFLRYALVPWNENLVDDAERLAFARLALQETFGSISGDWSVALDQQPAGQNSFACAMDRALLQALRDTVSRRRMRLRSVRTVLADRINRHRRGMKEQVFCLASLEPGRLTLAFHGEDGWIAVRARRVNGSLEDSLASVLRQEAAAVGAVDGGTLYLIAEDAAALPPFALHSWQVTPLDDFRRPTVAAGQLAPAD
jgi:hypothetical protein